MIHIESVDLEAINLRLPSDRVGIVIAQPFIGDDSLSPSEPFQCTAAARAERMATITRTLAISRGVHHGATKTHFTIFPEYCIPGPDGIALIDDAVRANDWPSGTIVIGGSDALTQAQYRQVLQAKPTHCDLARNGPDQVGDRWVNCAITWIKAQDGVVQRWLQPKIQPSWPEMHIPHEHMFNGRSVFVFGGRLENGAPYRFATLICFDWVATVEMHAPFQWILADLNNKAANGGQLPISWLFIIQRNPKPSHDTFLTRINEFFDQTEFPNALRDRACLVFANTAGKSVPGRVNEYGGCSVVASPQALFKTPLGDPTFSGGGPRFRDGSSLISTCKDVVFRERGACIYSFAQVNPGSVQAGPAGRTFAVDVAQIFPVSGADNPRAPAGAVSATVKWVNDELDELEDLGQRHSEVPLAPATTAAHGANLHALRSLTSQAEMRVVRLATQESPKACADEWDTSQSEALEHVVHTLDILRVAFAPPAPSIPGDPVHASIDIANQIVDLIAVRGVTHNTCLTHANSMMPPLRRPTLLISRDRDNTRWAKKLGSFLQPAAPAGEEPKITDPSSGMQHIGYQNLLEPFMTAQNAAALAVAIRAELAS